MKRLIALLLVATALLAAGTTSAQEKKTVAPEDKGWWIGGEAGFWHNTEDGLSTNSFALSPEVGYDFNKRWAVGVGIGYALVSAETGFGGVERANIFIFNPYARWKYYNTGRVALFLDGGLGVAGGDMDGVKIGIQPGLAVRVGKHVRLQAHFGFLGYCSNYFNDAVDESDGFGLKFSSSDLKFGFYYTF